MGTTVVTITNILTQLFIEEIIVDKTKINRYQLASIKSVKRRLKTREMKEKWNDLPKQLKRIPGKIQGTQKYVITLRPFLDYSEIIEWYAGCSFFDKRFLLKNRKITNIDNITGDDSNIQKREEEMDKFETEIWKYHGSTVLRTLNAGHDQLVERLKKGYAKLQAKE